MQFIPDWYNSFTVTEAQKSQLPELPTSAHTGTRKVRKCNLLSEWPCAYVTSWVPLLKMENRMDIEEHQVFSAMTL